MTSDDGYSEGVPLPLARTRREAALYRSLHPCVCGEWRVDELSTCTTSTENGSTRREQYLCRGCQQVREFLFTVPDGEDSGPETTYGGDRSSELLDPGEWLWVAVQDAQRAMVRSRDDHPDGCYAGRPWWRSAAGRPALRRTRRRSDAGSPLWRSAAAAVDEALKFVPPGADRIPEDAVRSDLGRAAQHAGRHAGTEPLGRVALENRARRYRNGRSVGDEFVMPAFGIRCSGDCGRDRLLRSLMDRLFRAQETGDTSVIRSPEALLEIEGMCGPNTAFDLLGMHVCGLVSWERYLCASGDEGLEDLVRAMALMTAVHEHLPRYKLPEDEQLEIPDELLVLIRAGAADA